MWGERKPVVMRSSSGCSGSSDYAGSRAWIARFNYGRVTATMTPGRLIAPTHAPSTASTSAWSSLGWASHSAVDLSRETRHGAESPYLNACAGTHTY